MSLCDFVCFFGKLFFCVSLDFVISVCLEFGYFGYFVMFGLWDFLFFDFGGSGFFDFGILVFQGFWILGFLDLWIL